MNDTSLPLSASYRAARVRIAACVVVVLIGAVSLWARSFVAITTIPSFRLGNDLGRLEWYLDIGWHSSVWKTDQDTLHLSVNILAFTPSLGCNITLYDSVFVAYVGARCGSDLRFYNGEFSDEIDIDLGLGGGVEWRMADKLGLIGEYLLGCWFTLYPDTPEFTNTRAYGFLNRPSLQLRYYIGPQQ